jgi:hypothetical protein
VQGVLDGVSLLLLIFSKSDFKYQLDETASSILVFQVQSSGSSSKYHGILLSFKRIIQEEGFTVGAILFE